MARTLCVGLALVGLFASGPMALAQAGAADRAGPVCGVETPCTVASGSYRIRLPQRLASGRIGAIVYFHGYQGTAAEIVADPGLAERLGVALVAPDGIGRSWSFPGSPARNRDEFAFVGQVLDDVTARFPVDPGRIMASGFSQGGSLVWYLACRMPQRFAAFVPIAGDFWEPLPESCAAPRPKLVHVHGTADTTIPLAGRALRGGFRQGSLFHSLAVFAPAGCTASWPELVARVPEQGLLCQRAADCGEALLELCLHAGGHYADAAWVERAWHDAMPPARALAVRTPLTSP